MAPGWWREYLKRPSLVAATAVIAIALVVIVGPQVRELLPRPAARPSPHGPAVFLSPGFADVPVPLPTPKPSPLPNLGRTPAGVPVLWVKEANGLVAYSWQGQPLGALAVDATQPSPDGQTLWTGESFVGARGDLLSTPPLPLKFTWAGGSDGVCGVDSGGLGTELWAYRLGTTARISVRVLPAGVAAVAGCSFQRDLALVRAGGAYVTDLYWVRLHDGAVLGHKTYAPNAVAGIVAAPDLRYFAENYDTGPHPNNQTEATAVRRVADGSLLASRDDLVLAFAADDTELVTGAFNAGTVGVFSLTGRRLWTPRDGPADWARSAPFGAEFAMVASGPDGQPNVLQLVTAGRPSFATTLPDGAQLLT